MVQIDDERAEPVMRRIEQLELNELEELARRLVNDAKVPKWTASYDSPSVAAANGPVNRQDQDR
jgi:hypothetical protein